MFYCPGYDLSYCILHGYLVRMCILYYLVKYPINVDYILLVDAIAEFFSVLTDFLSSLFYKLLRERY